MRLLITFFLLSAFGILTLGFSVLGWTEQPFPTHGIDTAQTSSDPTYGFSKDNPVKLGGATGTDGPAMEEVYLNHLRDANSKRLQSWERVGSLKGPDGHIVDRYYVIDSRGAGSTLYLDMYHPELPVLRCLAPKGMFVWK